ncbi:glycosyltransferase involved in cell wall biosynthesis [Flavobacteriaceae bacterium MAR_2009_75]|nr:glycosyltransferase involved in cell wall biosynthesis [Flavobacteriaceae bacterium MAR_2009_75]
MENKVNVTFKESNGKKRNSDTKVVSGRTSKSRGAIKPHESRKVVEVVCISSYPPRECGIATFSKDLRQSLQQVLNGTFKVTVCSLESGADKYSYSDEVAYSLNSDRSEDFVKVATALNNNPNIALILIQHEFGLFENRGDEFINFLRLLEKPIVLTFHTVLPNPDNTFKKQVQQIVEHCSRIIVMTEKSAEILKRDYALNKSTINIIPHGTHLIDNKNKTILKETYGFSGKTILSTFGLLGPGKSIETTLLALPGIITEHPDVLFLIIGKTHPVLVKNSGEDYRIYLEGIVEKLGLQNHVKFVNRFLDTNQLLDHLQFTDIYLFTSKDPNQAVSGTFAYALSCGCPIISTPIPHAVEVLKNGAGVIFDFSDSGQLRNHVINLLKDKDSLLRMKQAGLHTTASSSWQNVALAHADFFQELGSPQIKLKYRKPPIDLTHLKKMTTEVGILQFCQINQPDYEWGYTLDDNARALIAFCRYYKLTRDHDALQYIRRYFNFVERCFRPNGQFLNYVDKYYLFTEQNNEVNLEDANGRAIWALGNLLSVSKLFPEEYSFIQDKAKFLFRETLSNAEKITSPRAMAFVIKGISFYALEYGIKDVENLVHEKATSLVNLYHSSKSDGWRWYEDYLTYGNAVIPQALLMASMITGKSSYRNVAKSTFDFLLDKIYTEDSIRVISNKRWYKKGETLSKEFIGGEQPIDVAYTILALELFEMEFPGEGYANLQEVAFNWFLGNNPLRQSIYNHSTGGCFDGIERTNVSLNQGAESTVSYLLARLTFKDNLTI